MRWRRFLLSFILLCVVAAVDRVGAADGGGTVRTARLRSSSAPVPRIVNGVRAGGLYPTVGMLLRGGGFQFCSGTLIGCDKFLTAAHCVHDPIVPAQYSVFLQHVGFVGVSSLVRNPDFEFGMQGDDAVVTLSITVTGVSPSSINTLAEPPLGTLGDIVGFGGVGELFGPGTSTFLAGIKRRGDVVTAACDEEIPDSSHVCWDFEAPLGPPGTDSNTCHGDSGGPLFADVDGLGTVVAGVTSGGSDECLPDETPFDADVAFDHAWIESVAGDLGPPSCGPVPPLFGAGSDVLLDNTSGMEITDSAVIYQPFAVPAATTLLRVTLNGWLVPGQNYDLYVKFGAPPTITPPDYDCASTHDNSFESCSFPSPASGNWYVRIENPSASEGEYDLTASLLGSPFDADGNGTTQPLTDGLLESRYLFELTGSPLTDGVLGPGAERGAPEIVAFLDFARDALDIDDNGEARPLTDGVLLLRYLSGERGDTLIEGAVAQNCARCEAAPIETYIESLL